LSKKTKKTITKTKTKTTTTTTTTKTTTTTTTTTTTATKTATTKATNSTAYALCKQKRASAKENPRWSSTRFAKGSNGRSGAVVHMSALDQKKNAESGAGAPLLAAAT
jgi:hypothetical protein